MTTDVMSLLARAAKSVQDEQKPWPDVDATLLHLAELLNRSYPHREFHRGDIVTLTIDSGYDSMYIGRPHVILQLKSEEDRVCGHDTATVLIATIDKDGDIVMSWTNPILLEDWKRIV